MAGNICQALAETAHRVIGCRLTKETRVSNVREDVAGSIRKAVQESLPLLHRMRFDLRNGGSKCEGRRGSLGKKYQVLPQSGDVESLEQLALVSSAVAVH